MTRPYTSYSNTQLLAEIMRLNRAMSLIKADLEQLKEVIEHRLDMEDDFKEVQEMEVRKYRKK